MVTLGTEIMTIDSKLSDDLLLNDLRCEQRENLIRPHTAYGFLLLLAGSTIEKHMPSVISLVRSDVPGVPSARHLTCHFV